MLITTIIVAFIVLFAVVLLAVSVGLKYLEARRKKDVTAMLKTASGEAQPQQTKILKEIIVSSNTLLERMFAGMDVAKTIQNYIKQADLTWSFEGFALFTLVGIVAGALLGTRLKMLPTSWLGPLMCAMILGAAPFAYLYHTRSKRLGAIEEQMPE